MTPGVLYPRYRIAVGRFVAVRSMCESVRAACCARAGTAIPNNVENRVKMWKRNTGTNIRREKTGSCLMSLLIHVSSSTSCEIGDGGSWEFLIFHWDSVMFSGAFSG